MQTAVTKTCFLFNDLDSKGAEDIHVREREKEKNQL